MSERSVPEEPANQARSPIPKAAAENAGDFADLNAALTLKDVTELLQAGELLNQIFDSTHMQIVYLDAEFNFVRVNRAYAAVCGHDPGFLAGRNLFTLQPHPENEAIFRRVRDTGEPFSMYEKPFEDPDQPERGVSYWDWSLRPIHNKKGVIDGYLFCLLDVTQRVKARRELVASEQKYRELVEFANSIIMRITPEHDITFFNEYAQAAFGFTADEILGRNVVGTIMPPVDSEGRDLRRMVREITTHPELHGSNENENMCKDGRRVWVHWSNRAIRDEQGRVKEILCVGTDITERKRLERETEAYRKRLRTLADRLATTEEQARRRIATQIHDSVVQTLSLANIRLGGVQAAMEQAGLPDQRKRVEEIRQLLDQGATECRGLMEELVPALLYEMGLQAALREFAEKHVTADGTRIRVESADPEHPMDDALRGLLFQCARELITNALKYAGPCEIRVSTSCVDGHVQLQVRDTGQGFEPRELDGMKGCHQDGGFGLFNIRERLEGLRGCLQIESAPGRGTTATVRVPLATQGSVGPPGPEHAEAKGFRGDR